MDTWHYGLIARWWAEFNQGGPEVAFFQKIIERNGTPGLDLGCGTGRLLVPFLTAGLDVDGVDVSSDMLDYCRDLAAKKGREPHLYQQAIHRLDLPRRYKTIICCGSFGLAGTREDDLEGLRRVRGHLLDGGLFVFDQHLPTASAKAWEGWVRVPDGEPRWSKPDRRTASDGSELEMQMRENSFNPLTQVSEREIKIEQYKDGELIARDQYPLTINVYLKSEIELMLRHAGFSHIDVRAGLEDRAPEPYRDHYLTFFACA